MRHRLSCCVAALWLAGAVSAQAVWTQRYSANEPPIRQLHAMAYDASRATIVVFGGVVTSGTLLGDTWERAWDANLGAYDWKQRNVPAPSPRWGAAMAFHPATKRLVMFGGQPSGSANGVAETWEWDGAIWVQRSPALSPPSRYAHAMAYDAARGEIVMFGGHRAGTFLGDTWVFDGLQWIPRSPARSPTARADCAMAYDAARERVVLFGGGDASTVGLPDTWEWDGADWTQRLPANSPSGRSRHAMAYDELRRRVVLYGGTNTPGFTWEWDGTNWTWSLVPPPGAREAPGMVYAVECGRVVLFGGYGASAGKELADTWEYFVPRQAAYTPFGAGCAGSAGTPSLAPAPGQLPWICEPPFTLILSPLPPGSPGALGLIGLSRNAFAGLPLPLSLAALGAPGCDLLVSIDVTMAMSIGNGAASWAIPSQLNASLVGATIFVQGFALDPAANAAGAVLSNAGEVTFGAR